jgi:hypothetical protein
MNASALLADLQSRGVKVWPDGDRIHLDAPRGVLSDADRDAVKAIKAQMLALLTRPALGSIRRPLSVRGRKLERCPFDGCAGAIASHQTNLKLCTACGWYFELLPPVEGQTR